MRFAAFPAGNVADSKAAGFVVAVFSVIQQHVHGWRQSRRHPTGRQIGGKRPLVPLDEMRSLTSCCVQAGILTFLVKEVEHLVRGSAWFQMDVSQCEQCGRSPNDLLQLESELHLTQEAADKLQRLLTDKTEEAKRREEEATSFKNQVTSHSHQLKIANSWHFYSKCLRNLARWTGLEQLHVPFGFSTIGRIAQPQIHENLFRHCEPFHYLSMPFLKILRPNARPHRVGPKTVRIELLQTFRTVCVETTIN